MPLPEKTLTAVDDYNPNDWKNAPTLGDLKQELDDADSAHSLQSSRIDDWLDNLHVTGNAVPRKVEGHSQFQPKLIRKQNEWRYAALSEPFHSTKDIFKVKPRTFEDAEGARQNSLLLNYQFTSKINKCQFIDEYIRAAVDEGTAIVKVAWEFEEEEYEEVIPIYDYQVNEEMAQLHQELAQLKQANPREYNETVPEQLQAAHERSMQEQLPLEAIQVGEEVKMSMRTVKNQPSLEVCDYRNIIIDPSCGSDLDRASFVIHRFETSMSNLERAGIYANLDKVNVEGSSPLNEPDLGDSTNDANFNFKDKPRKRLVAHEYWGYWDIDGSGAVKPIIAVWIGSTLIRMEESPCPDKKLPFIIVPTLPVKNSVYGEPDGELLLDNQKIIGAVTRGMIDIMGKSANGQMGMMKGSLDAVNRRKFQKGLDYEYNNGSDPRIAFHMHTYPEIPNSAQYILQMQNLEAESLSGIKAFSQGISGAALGDVATAVTGALDAAAKREMGMLRRIASGIERIGIKMMQYNAELLDDEEVIRITNDSHVAISRDALSGTFDMIIDISSAEEDNVKAQELAFMLQTIGNNIDPGMTNLILRDIARLRKMPELAEKIENFQPEPDPIQEKLKELAVVKAEAEIAEIQSKIAENNAEARKKNAEADASDLDFVEQESGVTQERQKELSKAQAQGNIELETHKAKINQATELAKYVREA